MTEHFGRRVTSWQDDARGGMRSILLEVLVVIVLGLLGVIVAWVATAVV